MQFYEVQKEFGGLVRMLLDSNPRKNIKIDHKKTK